MRSSVILAGALTATTLLAQNRERGQVAFENRCGKCHGSDGNGGELGPRITFRLTKRTDGQLATLVRTGIPARNMPPTKLGDDEMALLITFLRSIQRLPESKPVERRTILTIEGKKIEGQIVGEGFDDLQLRTDDKRVHLLRRAGNRYREVTSETAWPTYDGGPDGNRYTKLTQINKGNVSRLGPKWMFSIPNGGRMEVTPVVVDGIMYVTVANECYALDAGSGREIWHYIISARGTGSPGSIAAREWRAVASSWTQRMRTSSRSIALMESCCGRPKSRMRG